jgi:hypothetical protein
MCGKPPAFLGAFSFSFAAARLSLAAAKVIKQAIIGKA